MLQHQIKGRHTCSMPEQATTQRNGCSMMKMRMRRLQLSSLMTWEMMTTGWRMEEEEWGRQKSGAWRYVPVFACFMNTYFAVMLVSNMFNEIINSCWIFPGPPCAAIETLAGYSVTFIICLLVLHKAHGDDSERAIPVTDLQKHRACANAISTWLPLLLSRKYTSMQSAAFSHRNH